MKKNIRQVVAAVIEKDGKVLVARRKPGLVAGGMWEFPGGKVEDGESAEKCLERELMEELGVRSQVGALLCSVPFTGTLTAFELLVFRTELLSDSFTLIDHDEVRWQAPGDMDEALFSTPDRPVVLMLAGLPSSSRPASFRAGRAGESGVNAVVLKPGRDKAVRNRHHWIFSGAIRDLPEFENGAVLPVRGSGGDLLGHGYFNRKSSITGRMVSFGSQPPEEGIRSSIERALALRAGLFDPSVTNARRLINAEGDGLPGLIADLYDDVLVLQFATLGMEKLKPFILDTLTGSVRPRAVLEKSDLPARREEGLAETEGLLAGERVDKIRIIEGGIPYWVSFAQGQKTGFYLDQRESRRLVRDFAAGRRILNAFSYTGAFSVCALKGGAARADSVDSSASAIALARENFELNGLPADSGVFFTADVFEFLRGPALDHDFIILDPPAFAKKKADVVAACRGYKDINRLAFQRVRSPGLVLTFSCSHHVDEGLFQQVVFQAALEAGRRVRILQKHRQACDHPVNIYHPETSYLKGFLLYVD